MLTAERTSTLLQGVRAGDGASRLALQEGLYEELRALAGALFRGQGPHTLQPTALVHEAWAKLAGAAARSEGARDRSHFMAVAASAMRQVLVDHARGKQAAKRGGGARRLSMDVLERLGGGTDPVADGDAVLAVHEGLERLARLSPRQAQVVELRTFAGMSVEETAAALGVSTRTVEVDWRLARAWLSRELAHADG